MLAGRGGAAQAYQGGTDLLIRIRQGSSQPGRLVDLKGLPGMQELRVDDEGWLILGAACPMNRIAESPLVQERHDLLVQACRSIGSYQLRSRATIGGNCCNASPAADTLPALYCLSAAVGIYGIAGTRILPVDELILGPGRVALQSGEFLTSIRVPPSPPGAFGVYNKLGSTKKGDIAVASVAVYAWPEGGARRQWRIAMGAVAPAPVRAVEAEAVIAASDSQTGIARAAALCAAAAQPIDDARASAAYRRVVVVELARRGIEAVLRMPIRPGSVPAAGGPA